MHPLSRTRFTDRAIAAHARRQFGVVSRRQLLAAGISAQQVRTRLRTGRLHQVHRGVYLVGHEVPARFAMEMAALLACGDAAVASHMTAASLWDIVRYPVPGAVCVTIPRGRNATRSGIVIHRADLDPRDTRRRHRMSLTSPPRTILDLAGCGATGKARIDPLAPQRLDDLEQLVAEASYRRLASESELRDQVERNPNKPGGRALRAVLDLPGGPKRTRSRGERAMLRLLREHQITGFEVNAKVAGYEVDFLWADLAFAVEVDGYDGHAGRAAFERDRLKASVLGAHGIAVMPVTGRQIRRDPDGVVARLLAALRERPARRVAGCKGEN